MRSLADEARAVFVRLLVYAGVLAALALLIAGLVTGPWAPLVAAEDSAPAAASNWITIGRPHAAFSTTIADLDDLGMRYEIRRHANGQGRKDAMIWGDPGILAPIARIEIYRAGPERHAFGRAETEIATLTTDVEPVEPFTSVETLDTKFGPVDLLEFAVSGPGSPRRCLGFSRAFDDPMVRIAGWYCNAGPEIVERSVLSCALDRLTLLSAGSEPKLGGLFAHAELKRTFCGRNGQILAATPKRNDWLDGSKEPKLRGAVTAR